MGAQSVARVGVLGCAFWWGWLAGIAWGADPAAPKPSLDFPRVAPTPADRAAETIRAQHGFRLELLAAEPLVTDPVAIDYDENGRAYVCEMSDYPHTNKAADKPFAESAGQDPVGRVRWLEDTNGDGKFDRSGFLAEGLSWPTGVACWKGGVYVAATPDLWYFKDTDGDGRADVRRQVFTGFRKFNVQAVMNNLKWGPDNKIYGAGSSNSGTLRHVERPDDPPVTLGRHDFRFDPRTEKLELVSGGARFGNAFDDWGHRFLCNIRNPVQQVVLPEEYLKRNPHLPVRNAVFDSAEAGDTLPVFRISPLEPWRKLRAERWAAEAGQNYPRSETNAGHYFTSSSGVTIYRGAAYPREFYGQAFVGEVACNAIHRQTLRVDGVTFRAERADRNVEFVASTDNWFRPVNFINAPDGTLHVLDMYRETIEHPWSIPDDILSVLDLQSGRDRGRIYRLAPPGFQTPPPPRLGSASLAELVATLENPNSWWRETAQRLLVERGEAATTGLLKKLLRTSRSELARFHALVTLDGLESLDDDDLLVGLADLSAGVRARAALLAEPRLSYSSRLLEPVAKLARDPSAHVRFQIAFSLGEVDDPVADAALVEIARRDAADVWIRTAVLSAAPRRADRILTALWQGAKPDGGNQSLPMFRELALVAASAESSALTPLRLAPTLPAFAPAVEAAKPWQMEVVLGLTEGLKRRGKRLAALRASDEEATERMLATFLLEAARDAVDERLSAERRLQAVELLGFDEYDRAVAALVQLLDARQPPALQQAAVKALSGFARPEVAQRLLDAYPGLTPTVRGDVVEALASRPERGALLVDALEWRVISLYQLSAARRNALAKHADPNVRQRMERLLAGAAPSPRREVLGRYQTALQLAPNRERGRAVYARECQNCHRLNGQGHDVGPNLETIRNRTRDELLVNVLDPNREVSPNYVEFTAELADGRLLTGLIASETASSVTLRRAEGKEETVLRGEVDRLTSSGKSLMPEGLEQKISPQEMADLLAYLKGM